MQAARGASLSPSEPVNETTTPRLRRTRLIFALVAVLAYGLDLGTKELALRRLADGDVALLGDWFTLHLTHNPGAAFSTGTGYTEVFSVLAIVAVCVVLYVSRRLHRSAGWAWALGLLLGGVAGNLTDRLVREPGPLRGHVVDFLMLPNWPVFNVADICINTAAGLIILQSFRGIAVDGSRHAHAGEDDEGAPDEPDDTVETDGEAGDGKGTDRP